MSSIVENRACLACTGRSVHFRDSSWKKNGKWKLYKGYCRGELNSMQVVVLLVPIQDMWTEEDCDMEIEKYEQIRELAKEFNNKYNSKIKVMVPRKAIIDRTAGVHGMKFRTRTLSRDEWVLVFENIGKNLKTFVWRNGLSTKCSTSTLEAFVHFTYQQSGGNSVVSKLRGVDCRSGQILSRPSLITDHQHVMKVMKNHTCNSLCQGFLKPQDLVAAAERIPVPAQPSAPPPEDAESDEEVFWPNGLSKDDQLIQFSLEMDSANQYHAIPFHLYPGPGQMPNYREYGMSGQCYDQPPAYSSNCPNGHRAVTCGSPDGNGNFAATQPWCFNNILLMGDTAPVQQASMVGGLS